eukprot:TRINITY_DN3664_c0_g1_i4.p1 TRINITY_DN3664_c0_g1~~TRINITY_DN3664_c0_g1_i4.p1  ORF type:complete len:169 (+),score=26.41 TRINITY_DN3664_c0_g1_i4:42-509(+)
MNGGSRKNRDTEVEMMYYSLAQQDMDLDNLSREIGSVKDIAGSTLQSLRDQTEMLSRIDSKVDGVNSLYRRAHKSGMKEYRKDRKRNSEAPKNRRKSESGSESDEEVQLENLSVELRSDFNPLANFAPSVETDRTIRSYQLCKWDHILRRACQLD